MFDPKKECYALRNRIAEDRRTLHEHPELSGQEQNTLHWIESRLDSLGIPHHAVENGGLVALLKGRAPGKRLLLRADIDALPVEENQENMCCAKRAVSKVPGVSHACGHDAHTAMLLGAVEVLAAHREDWDGEIVAVFEQGEENASGVIPILGHLTAQFDGFDGSFALHVYADAPEGTISVQPGFVMSGALSFDVTLTGRGGHASRPDYCANPIDCFVGIYNGLASARMRRTDPAQSLTYAMGVVQAGSQSNIIPQTLRFAGTARFFDAESCGKPFLEELTRCVESNAALYGCEVKYNRLFGPAPGVYNDRACAALAEEVLRKALGEDTVQPAPPWMASESMSLYQTLYCGVLGFLGIQNSRGAGAPHHAPEFDLDEDLLYLGAAAHAAYAMAFLDHGFQAPPRRDAAATLAALTKQF